MIGLTLMLLYSKPAIPLPENAFANFVFFDSETCFVLDTRDHVVYKLDLKGHLLATYRRTGFGPGEVTRIGQIYLADDELFILDHKQRKIVVTDKWLQFKRQFFMPEGGSIGNIAKIEKRYYAFYYDGKSKQVIHQFNDNFEKMASFGQSFVEGDEVPRQSNPILHFKYGGGVIIEQKGLLYCFPSYRYRIDEYDGKGELLGRYKIPGFEIEDLLHNNQFQLTMGFVQKDYRGAMYFWLYGPPGSSQKILEGDRLYRFDPVSRKFDFVTATYRWIFPAPDGDWIKTVEATETGQVRLEYMPDPFAKSGSEGQ